MCFCIVLCVYGFSVRVCGVCVRVVCVCVVCGLCVMWEFLCCGVVCRV